MIATDIVPGGPVISAAKKALETGNACHILIWVPPESENTLRNLLEKTCCKQNLDRDTNDPSVDWYFKTVSRIHSTCYGPRSLDISTKMPQEKTIIALVQRACESGSFEEISTVIPDIPGGDLRQRFGDVMKKRAHCGDTLAAGRDYVSAFTGFVAFINDRRTVSPES